MGANDPLDVGGLIKEMARTHASMIQLGAKSEREHYRAALRALEREFQASLLDPESKIRSSLQIAIATVCALASDE